jgi:primary-amine oxidase
MDDIEELPEGVQPQITPEELIACEDILRADPGVIKLAAEVGKRSHCIGAWHRFTSCSQA